jgi:hypothetical protein
MYKLRFFIVLLICLVVLPGLSFAAENQTIDKKNVAIIIANNEKDSDVKDTVFKKLLIDPATQKLSNRFVIITDTKYYEKFKSAGLYSIIDLEKNDIIDVLKDENIDYGVLIQALSSDGDANYTLMYHFQIKIIDFRTNKTLYNGKFSDCSISPQMNQILQIMDERLPKN